MRKKLLRGYILLAFLFIIYGASVMPFPKTAVFWIAFAYSVLAILAQGYTLYAMLTVQTPIKDRIYEYPQLRISGLYLAVQLLASLLLMGFSAKIPIFAAILVETVILAVAVTGFYAVGVAWTEAVRQDELLQEKLAKRKEWQTRMNLLISRCSDGQTGEQLQKLAEEIRYSNQESKAATQELEEEIDVLFTEMEAAALEDDAENTAEWCRRIIGLLRERDRVSKYEG